MEVPIHLILLNDAAFPFSVKFVCCAEDTEPSECGFVSPESRIRFPDAPTFSQADPL